MDKKIRLFIEISICILFGVIVGFFSDISSTFFNINLFWFYVYFYSIYFVIRFIFSLLFSFGKYKLTDKYKNYKGELAKVYLENSIYFKLMFISLFMVILGVLRVAFIVLFIIFALLYIFSYMSLIVQDNKMYEKNDTSCGDKLDDEIPYNLFRAGYYSKQGYELLKIITDNTFGILNSYQESNPLIMLDKLCKSNYLFFIQRSLYFGDINIFCGIINTYLKKLDIGVLIEKEDILKFDDSVIKTKRDNFKMTLYNDLKIVDDILKKKHYRIVSVGLWDDEAEYLCIGIVSDRVFTRLEKFKSKYMKE
ncbi:MAG: hypothetical protein HFE81_01490 [Bacilli bacterium]|nr:hypothetical protein [Bacilli bacterium]